MVYQLGSESANVTLEQVENKMSLELGILLLSGREHGLEAFIKLKVWPKQKVLSI